MVFVALYTGHRITRLADCLAVLKPVRKLISLNSRVAGAILQIDIQSLLDHTACSDVEWRGDGSYLGGARLPGSNYLKHEKISALD